LALGVVAGAWALQSFANRPAEQRYQLGGSGIVSGPIARAADAVVDIQTFTSFAGEDGLTPLGAGTGMILTSSGEVLTNNHVVAGSTSIQISIGGGDPIAATVVGADPTDDVALLRLQGASGLPTVRIGDSAAVHVGDRVAAIGNAFGRGGPPTITTGTISGLHLAVTAQDPGGASEHLTNVIQTDAEVRPGDSGGALVNSAGQVVGMITAGPSGRAGLVTHGSGVAIASNGALAIVNEIRAGHETSKILLGQRGFLGVQVTPLDTATAARLGADTSSGALVVHVLPGSPAERAGMTAPAVIESIDGKTIGSLDALGPAIHVHTPGEQIQVTWIDEQGTHTASVGLISGPAV